MGAPPPLTPVQGGGPGVPRVAGAIIAAVAIVVGAALAGGGFPIIVEGPRTPSPRPLGSPGPTTIRTPVAFSPPPPPTCPARPTPPASLRVTEPAPGSTWSTEWPLPIAGSGAPQAGTLIVRLADDVGTIISGTQVSRIATDGSFASHVLLYPPAAPTGARLTVNWIPPGAQDVCEQAGAMVQFGLDPRLPISVWLLGGPPPHLPGPPYSVSVVTQTGVSDLTAALQPASGPTVAARFAGGEIIDGRYRQFDLRFPDALPRGPAALELTWSGPRPGSLTARVVVVEPESEVP